MIIVKYENEEEAQQIIAEKLSQGLVLVAVSNVTEGNFLGFTDSPIPPKAPIEEQLDEVKEENAILKQQLAQTNADAVAFQDFIFANFPELA